MGRECEVDRMDICGRGLPSARKSYGKGGRRHARGNWKLELRKMGIRGSGDLQTGWGGKSRMAAQHDWKLGRLVYGALAG